MMPHGGHLTHSLRGNDHIAVAVKWPRCDSGGVSTSGILRRGTGLGNLSMLYIYTMQPLRIRAINTLFHLRKCCKSPKNGVPAQDGKFVIALGRTQHYHWVVAAYRHCYPDEPFTVIQLMPTAISAMNTKAQSITMLV